MDYQETKPAFELASSGLGLDYSKGENGEYLSTRTCQVFCGWCIRIWSEKECPPHNSQKA